MHGFAGLKNSVVVVASLGVAHVVHLFFFLHPSGQRLGHVGAVPAGVGQQAPGEEEGSRTHRGRGRRGRVRRRPCAHDRPACLAFPL